MKNVLVTDENPSTDKRGLCEKTKQSTVSGGQIGPIKDVGGPGEGPRGLFWLLPSPDSAAPASPVLEKPDGEARKRQNT